MKSSEFKRWLLEQGASFRAGKGSHLKGHAEWQALGRSHAQQRTRYRPCTSDQETIGPQIGDDMRYPVKMRRDGKYFLVTFPDIPEAITQGESEAEALKAARDALESALDFYFEAGRIVPSPSAPKRGQRHVELPVSLSAKVLLLNEMLRQKVRPAELARRLHTTPQEVNRLINVRHTSKIDGIAEAMKALGKSLHVSATTDEAA